MICNLGDPMSLRHPVGVQGKSRCARQEEEYVCKARCKNRWARQRARAGSQAKMQGQVHKARALASLRACFLERQRELICLFERESALKKRIWERESWYFSLRDKYLMCLFEREKINMSLWERHHSLSLTHTHSLSLSPLRRSRCAGRKSPILGSHSGTVTE